MGGDSALASIVVTMNEPPSGGGLSVEPASGTALSTTYRLTSAYWEDDEDDFPLVHVLSYYILDSTKLIAVKGPDEVSYASTILGQGLEQQNKV